jgi:DNA-binding CsgD family transcriptional regulator
VIVRPVLCRPFIGRSQELAYLRERRLEAGSSHGGLVLLGGDAGMGKTRLIGEFCTTLAYSRWKVGQGTCLEFASRPYGPILEAFGRLDARPFVLSSAAGKREQFEAIGAHLAALAGRSALVIVIEDLHWADAATLDFLAYLGPALQRMRVLVVASVRADELFASQPAARAIGRIVRAAGAGRIDLAPLRGAELEAFIAEALDGLTLPERTRRAIALTGDGNPFFTEELLKSAVERHYANAPARGERDVPQNVRTTLLERLRPLTEDERRVVTQAAAIGRTFGLELLAATLGSEPEALLPALRRARDYQLVEEIAPTQFRFRHGLTREAIYGDFLGAELRPRHRTIARALEDAPPEQRSLEALAYHWWAAGDRPAAARYNELAGDSAANVHAHDDAIAFYERALECAVDATVRGSVTKKIADRRLAIGLTKEAQATYGAAADIFRAAADREQEAACRVAAAITAYGIGAPNPTKPLEAMLERLPANEDLARSRLHLGLAWLWATFAHPFEAARHLARVDERLLVTAPDVTLRYHNVAAFIAMTRGDLDTFRSEHEKWAEAAQLGGSLSALAGALINGAMGYAFFGLHEEAQDGVERALRLAREARNTHTEETVHAFAAMFAYLRGDLAATRAELAGVSPASENKVSLTFATAFGSLTGAALDDPVLLETWFDRFEGAAAAKPEIECGAGFAEVLVRRGRARDAAELLHRALPECELIRGNVPTLLAIGRYGARDDRNRARTYLERAAQGPREMPERPALALFDAYACQRDGRTHEARRLALDAAEGFRRVRYPLFEAAALEVAGDLTRALALYRRCGAVSDERRLAGGGGAAANSAEQSAAERSAAELLSDREREIAMLALEGRSNLDIAGRLHITHKTVEKHLASAYRKLGISSRAGLRDRLASSVRAT